MSIVLWTLVNGRQEMSRKGNMRLATKTREFVVEVRDVNLFGDGVHYMLYVDSEDISFTRGGVRKLGPKARVYNVKRQDPENPVGKVYLDNKVLEKARKKLIALEGKSS